MFYSQTFLARKGPLGTVWCAAHLQHKLKKSHYANTDINSSVDRIMTPDVPIALRMYGHLLLGVVRIYSKKVEYLHRDCNLLWVSLRNAFRAPDVNLPENATQAQFNAVTLPETFALADVDIDDTSLFDGSPDNHLRNHDEITLKDQYPTNSELYVRITFDDDIIPDTSNSVASLHQEDDSMQIDNPRVPDSPTPAIRVPDSIQSDEPPEVLRDADHVDFMSSPFLRPHDKTATFEPLVPPLKDPTEKLIDTPQGSGPRSIHLSPPTQPMRSPQGSGPSSPPDRAPIEVDSFVADRSTDLVVRPTPPERPQPLPRKRKQLFDVSIALTNVFYKKALGDPSDLVVKRRKLPSFSLDMWRYMNHKNKEQLFVEPLITGMCSSLKSLSNKDLIALNPNLVRTEVQLEAIAAESCERGPDFTEATEHLRSPDRDTGHQVFSSPLRSQVPPHGSAEISPSSRSPSMVTEPRFNTTGTTQSDPGIFTHSTLGMDTPIMNPEEANYNLDTALSDIPEWRDSTESDGLFFLEQDDINPPDSQGGREKDPMSVRTRAVAQYLKNHSPSDNLSEGLPEYLSLNTILEGRRRKLCARMFFEILVLKDRQKIDVKQDEPYGDITLRLIPASAKEADDR